MFGQGKMGPFSGGYGAERGFVQCIDKFTSVK
jgi:hypothetical protein